MSRFRKPEAKDQFYYLKKHFVEDERNAHAFALGVIRKVRDHEKVAVLTDNSNNVKLIARRLLDEGLKGRKVYVCENLSLDKEMIREYDVSSLLRVQVKGLNVIIILDEDSSE